MKYKPKKIVMSLIAAGFMSLGLMSASQAERGSPRIEYYGQTVDQMVYEFMEKKHVSGVTLAIVQAPYVPRVSGYGETDISKKLLASSATLWSIAQITQGYTAVAIMQLVEANKMSVDAPISTYVSNLPDAWKKLTVKQLMQHATGLADYRNIDGFDTSREYKPQQLIDSVKGKQLAFKPGTNVADSATDFLLLGLAIEKASGMSYHDVIWQGQINPLGMTHTMFIEDFPEHTQQDAVENNGNRHKRFTSEIPYINPVEPAAGYVFKNGNQVSVARNTSSSSFAYGSLWASAEDVSLWDIGLAGNTLIKDPAHRALIYKPTTLDNGTVVPAMAGWQFTGHKGFMDIKGSVPGYSAYLSRFTDADELVCVTILANGENVDFTDLARRVAAAYDGSLGAGVDPVQIASYESVFNVEETAARLEKNIKAEGGTVFAAIDQQANAKQVKIDMLPAKVIVFGNPAVGTKLLKQNQSANVDLPLRVSIWQDDRKRTWVGYDNLDTVAAHDGIKDQETISKIKNGVEELVRKSASAY